MIVGRQASGLLDCFSPKCYRRQSAGSLRSSDSFGSGLIQGSSLVPRSDTLATICDPCGVGILPGQHLLSLAEWMPKIGTRTERATFNLRVTSETSEPPTSQAASSDRVREEKVPQRHVFLGEAGERHSFSAVWKLGANRVRRLSGANNTKGFRFRQAAIIQPIGIFATGKSTSPLGASLLHLWPAHRLPMRGVTLALSNNQLSHHSQLRTPN